jgi:heavy metal sensor kinase
MAVLVGILTLYAGATSMVFFLQLRAQLDHHAIEQLETVEGYFYFLPDGKLHLRTDYHDHPYPVADVQRFLEVRSGDGTVLYRSESLGNRQLDGPLWPAEGTRGYSPRSIRLPGGPRIRVISRSHPIAGRPLMIRLGLSEEHLWDTFSQATLMLLGGIPFALALAGFGGHYLAKKALLPIGAMSRRAREINAEQLNARLAVENPGDEVGQLATAFNDTLARLEKSFEQLRRFTSDAAHELRTPLTAIRSVGEVGLQRITDPARYRDVIESMLEEAGRLSRLVEGLLAIARADAGQIRLEPTPLPAMEQAREVVALLEVLAEEKRQSVRLEGDANLYVNADRVIFRQILINLLDNAIKYSPCGGEVSLKILRASDGRVAVDVIDSGPGIATEHQDRIFDRFYRVDQARARETGGIGLGLALAKWGAEAHGGVLQVLSTGGTGCTFRLLLPDGHSRAS